MADETPGSGIGSSDVYRVALDIDPFVKALHAGLRAYTEFQQSVQGMSLRVRIEGTQFKALTDALGQITAAFDTISVAATRGMGGAVKTVRRGAAQMIDGMTEELEEGVQQAAVVGTETGVAYTRAMNAAVDPSGRGWANIRSALKRALHVDIDFVRDNKVLAELDKFTRDLQKREDKLRTAQSRGRLAGKSIPGFSAEDQISLFGFKYETVKGPPAAKSARVAVGDLQPPLRVLVPFVDPARKAAIQGRYKDLEDVLKAEEAEHRRIVTAGKRYETMLGQAQAAVDKMRARAPKGTTVLGPEAFITKPGDDITKAKLNKDYIKAETKRINAAALAEQTTEEGRTALKRLIRRQDAWERALATMPAETRQAILAKIRNLEFYKLPGGGKAWDMRLVDQVNAEIRQAATAFRESQGVQRATNRAYASEASKLTVAQANLRAQIEKAGADYAQFMRSPAMRAVVAARPNPTLPLEQNLIDSDVYRQKFQQVADQQLEVEKAHTRAIADATKTRQAAATKDLRDQAKVNNDYEKEVAKAALAQRALNRKIALAKVDPATLAARPAMQAILGQQPGRDLGDSLLYANYRKEYAQAVMGEIRTIEREEAERKAAMLARRRLMTAEAKAAWIVEQYGESVKRVKFSGAIRGGMLTSPTQILSGGGPGEPPPVVDDVKVQRYRKALADTLRDERNITRERKLATRESERAYQVQKGMGMAVAETAFRMGKWLVFYRLVRDAMMLIEGGIRAVVRAGLEYTKQLELQQLGVQATMAEHYKVVNAQGEELEGAQKLIALRTTATEQWMQLQSAALAVVGQTQDLMMIYAGILPYASRLNKEISDVQEMTKAAAVAASLMDISFNDARTAMVSMLQGRWLARNRLVTLLGISREELTALKGTPELFDRINGALRPFLGLADRAQGTLGAMLETFKEFVGIIGAELEAPFIALFKNMTRGLQQALFDTQGGMLKVSAPVKAEFYILRTVFTEMLEPLRTFARQLATDGPRNINRYISALRTLVSLFVELAKAAVALTTSVGKFVAEHQGTLRIVAQVGAWLMLAGALKAVHQWMTKTAMAGKTMTSQVFLPWTRSGRAIGSEAVGKEVLAKGGGETAAAAATGAYLARANTTAGKLAISLGAVWRWGTMVAYGIGWMALIVVISKVIDKVMAYKDAMIRADEANRKFKRGDPWGALADRETDRFSPKIQTAVQAQRSDFEKSLASMETLAASRGVSFKTAEEDYRTYKDYQNVILRQITDEEKYVNALGKKYGDLAKDRKTNAAEMTKLQAEQQAGLARNVERQKQVAQIEERLSAIAGVVNERASFYAKITQDANILIGDIERELAERTKEAGAGPVSVEQWRRTRAGERVHEPARETRGPVDDILKLTTTPQLREQLALLKKMRGEAGGYVQAMVGLEGVFASINKNKILPVPGSTDDDGKGWTSQYEEQLQDYRAEAEAEIAAQQRRVKTQEITETDFAEFVAQKRQEMSEATRWYRLIEQADIVQAYKDKRLEEEQYQEQITQSWKKARAEQREDLGKTADAETDVLVERNKWAERYIQTMEDVGATLKAQGDEVEAFDLKLKKQLHDLEVLRKDAQSGVFGDEQRRKVDAGTEKLLKVAPFEREVLRLTQLMRGLDDALKVNGESITRLATEFEAGTVAVSTYAGRMAELRDERLSLLLKKQADLVKQLAAVQAAASGKGPGFLPDPEKLAQIRAELLLLALEEREIRSGAKAVELAFRAWGTALSSVQAAMGMVVDAWRVLGHIPDDLSRVIGGVRGMFEGLQRFSAMTNDIRQFMGAWKTMVDAVKRAGSLGSQIKTFFQMLSGWKGNKPSEDAKKRIEELSTMQSAAAEGDIKLRDAIGAPMPAPDIEALRRKYEEIIAIHKEVAEGAKEVGEAVRTGASTAGPISRLSASQAKALDLNRQAQTMTPASSPMAAPVAASTAALEQMSGAIASTVAASIATLSKPFEDAIQRAAAANTLDPALIRAIINRESGFNPAAKGQLDEVGLMQLRPGTAADMGVSDRSNSEENIAGGTKYLRQLLDEFKTLRAALIAFNWGPGNLRKAGGDISKAPASSRQYADDILGMAKAQGPVEVAAILKPEPLAEQEPVEVSVIPVVKPMASHKPIEPVEMAIIPVVKPMASHKPIDPVEMAIIPVVKPMASHKPIEPVEMAVIPVVKPMASHKPIEPVEVSVVPKAEPDLFQRVHDGLESYLNAQKPVGLSVIPKVDFEALKGLPPSEFPAIPKIDFSATMKLPPVEFPAIPVVQKWATTPEPFASSAETDALMASLTGLDQAQQAVTQGAAQVQQGLSAIVPPTLTKDIQTAATAFDSLMVVFGKSGGATALLGGLLKQVMTFKEVGKGAGDLFSGLFKPKQPALVSTAISRFMSLPSATGSVAEGATKSVTSAASKFMSALPMIGAGIGVAIGIFSAMFQKNVEKIKKSIEAGMKTVKEAMEDGTMTLGEGLAEIERQRQAAIAQYSKSKAGRKALKDLLPQFDDEIHALEQRIEQVRKSFQDTLASRQAGTGSFADFWRELKEFEKLAAEYLATFVVNSDKWLAASKEVNDYYQLLLQEARARFEGQLLGFEEEALSAQERVLDLQEEQVSLGKQLNDLAKQRLSLIKEEKGLQKDLKDLDKDKADLEKDKVRLQEDLAEAAKDLDAARLERAERLFAIEKQIRDLLVEAAQSEAEIRRRGILEAQLSVAEQKATEISKLRGDTAVQLDDLRKEKAKIASDRSAEEAYQDRLDRAKEEQEALAENLVKLDERRQELMDQLAEFQERFNELAYNEDQVRAQQALNDVRLRFARQVAGIEAEITGNIHSRIDIETRRGQIAVDNANRQVAAWREVKSLLDSIIYKADKWVFEPPEGFPVIRIQVGDINIDNSSTSTSTTTTGGTWPIPPIIVPPNNPDGPPRPRDPRRGGIEI